MYILSQTGQTKSNGKTKRGYWFRNNKLCPSKHLANNHRTLIKKHFDYTKSCDKCENWIPMHQSNNYDEPTEWDGDYCNLWNTNYSTSEYVGYSKMLEQFIGDMMERFMLEMYGEMEYKRATTFVANICPLYKEDLKKWESDKKMSKRWLHGF